MKRTIFITGTDTDVGKTYISVGLLRYFDKKGYSTVGLKPIASGCYSINGKLLNNDALQLSKAANVILPYEHLNPFALAEPIAPHIAAEKTEILLNLDILHKKMLPAFSVIADICLIEGAGGWLLPLNEKEIYADYVLQQNMEIILVVGMKLGCINHALLTCHAILQRRGKLIGWVANSTNGVMSHFDENLSALRQMIPAPLLGTVMPNDDPLLVFQQRDFS